MPSLGGNHGNKYIAAILGGSISGGLALFILVGIALFLCIRKNNRPLDEKTRYSQSYDPSSFIYPAPGVSRPGGIEPGGVAPFTQAPVASSIQRLRTDSNVHPNIVQGPDSNSFDPYLSTSVPDIIPYQKQVLNCGPGVPTLPTDTVPSPSPAPGPVSPSTHPDLTSATTQSLTPPMTRPTRFTQHTDVAEDLVEEEIVELPPQYNPSLPTLPLGPAPMQRHPSTNPLI